MKNKHHRTGSSVVSAQRWSLYELWRNR